MVSLTFLLCYLFFLLIAFFERAVMPAGQTSLTRHPPPLPCPSLILLRLMRMQGQFVKSFPVWGMSGKHRLLSEQQVGKR